MTRYMRLQHRYVDFIPKELDEGVLYISNRFKTASHLCCCGCGHKVVTPLNPARWSLTDHGSTVSLSPSIGLGTLPCCSHYWIRRSRVDWYAPMTMAQTAKAQHSDRYVGQIYTGERTSSPRTSSIASPPSSKSALQNPSLWAMIYRWIRSLWK